MDERNKKTFEFAITLLLASLSSLYLLFSYPPFYNGIDTTCYFNYPAMVPHYPWFYPFYCWGVLNIMHDGIKVIYGIIVIQHIFYTLGIAYAAFFFKQFKQRLLFLALMCFEFRASIFIHGVYTEAWAIVAVIFIMGALLRICLNPAGTHKKAHFFIYVLATVLLMLTRHAGVFLAFVLPLYMLLTALYSKKLFAISTIKSFIRQLLLSLILIIAAQLFTARILVHYHKTQFSISGRPGCYRISNAMNTACTYANPEKVLATYQNATNDTIVKCAFDIIKRTEYRGLWAEAYQPLDSVRREFISKGIIKDEKSTDDYLNSAYVIYIIHPGCYPYKMIYNCLCNYLANFGLYEEVFDDSNRFITSDYRLMPPSAPQLKQYLATQTNTTSYNRANHDLLIYTTGFLFYAPLTLLVVLLIGRRVNIDPKTWAMFIAAGVTVGLSYIATSVITSYQLRYAQPAEIMFYCMWCAFIAKAFPFKASEQLAGK